MNEQTPRATKDQLKVIALTQRIGELTSSYEERIADMRADVTQRQEDMQNQILAQHERIESLQKELEDVQKNQDSSKKTTD